MKKGSEEIRKKRPLATTYDDDFRPSQPKDK